jgi:hypothetical protein
MSKRADYTESLRPGQIFDAKLLILETNFRILQQVAGNPNGIAQ